MMFDERSDYILKRIEEAATYIQENWDDDISSQYLIYLQGVESKINKLERRREEINNRRMEIEIRCQSIASGSEDQPKVRKRSF